MNILQSVFISTNVMPAVCSQVAIKGGAPGIVFTHILHERQVSHGRKK